MDQSESGAPDTEEGYVPPGMTKEELEEMKKEKGMVAPTKTTGAEGALNVVTGVGDLSPRLTHLVREQVSRKDHLRANALENAIEWHVTDAWRMSRGSKLPGPKMSLTKDVLADAASILAGSKEEFFQGKYIGWDPSMKPEQLFSYLRKMSLRRQAEVAAC
jgi:hypothetical protein